MCVCIHIHIYIWLFAFCHFTNLSSRCISLACFMREKIRILWFDIFYLQGDEREPWKSTQFMCFFNESLLFLCFLLFHRDLLFLFFFWSLSFGFIASVFYLLARIMCFLCLDRETKVKKFSYFSQNFHSLCIFLASFF